MEIIRKPYEHNVTERKDWGAARRQSNEEKEEEWAFAGHHSNN